MKRSVGVVLAVVALTAFAGCGGGSSSSSAGSDEDQIQAVVDNAYKAAKAKDWAKFCSYVDAKTLVMLKQLAKVTNGGDGCVSIVKRSPKVTPLRLRDLVVKGDRATAHEGSSTDVVAFAKSNGRWYISAGPTTTSKSAITATVPAGSTLPTATRPTMATP
jgi:hypothetical protein